jgi:hypothetical protein
MKPIKLLPTFSDACVYRPTFLNLYWAHLARLGFAVSDEVSKSTYRRYAGDAAVPGKGEILVWESASRC